MKVFNKIILLFHLIKSILSLCGISLFLYGCHASRATNHYDVAAYIWPSCHDEPMSRDALWGEGIGEWEVIKKGNARFEGHYQPRIPLWGYPMDNDPVAVEQKIEAATNHGVNVFIYDWYWYDGKPFLEEAIDEGFLKARNNRKMKFYLMWANHDALGNTWNHYRYDNDTLLWPGVVDWDNYKIIVNRVINRYFKQPNYYKIDGKPVFSIYHTTNFVKSFNDLNGAKEALEYFRQEVKKAGFPGLHVQLIGRERNLNPHLLNEPYHEEKSVGEIVTFLGVNSVTMYNMGGRVEDYLKYGVNSMTLRERWDSTLNIPFFPCVSVGWDDTPRFPKKTIKDVVHINNTPESFGALLLKAKEYVKKHPDQPPLIVINAWNEWVEGSYLEPDMQWGYGYLEAVQKVMSGKYDQYNHYIKNKIK
jgi:hypothetical protein